MTAENHMQLKATDETWANAVGEHLLTLFETFAVVPTPQRIRGYLLGLEGLIPEQVELGCIAAIKTATRRSGRPLSEACPAAADIRQLVPTAAALEHQGDVNGDCRLCQGTGYKIVKASVQAREGEWVRGRFAVVCDCRKARRSA